MNMFDWVWKSKAINALEQVLRKNETILCEEIWNSPKALLMALAQKITGKHILVITSGGQKEDRLFHDFAYFTKRPVFEFPAWETLPVEEIPPSSDIVGERYECLSYLAQSSEPAIFLSNLQACLQKLIPKKTFSSLYKHLKVGNSYEYDNLIKLFEEMGYLRMPMAADKGEFAVRGNLIDIFPVSSPEPCRIEFWADEVTSIRFYDPIGQTSLRKTDTVDIPPAKELELIRDQATQTFLDHLGENTLVVFDDLANIEDHYATLMDLASKPSKYFMSLKEFLKTLDTHQKIYFTDQPIDQLSEVNYPDGNNRYYSPGVHTQTIIFEMFERSLTATRWKSPFSTLRDTLFPAEPEGTIIGGQELLSRIGHFADDSYIFNVLCETEQEEAQFHQRVIDEGIKLPNKTIFQKGYLSSGFIITDSNTVIFPLTEVRQRQKIHRPKLRSVCHTVSSDMFALIPGDLVVHLNHGLGKYQGIDKRPNHLGIESEFLIIEYANTSKLYVPVEQSYLVTKYIGAKETLPTLHQIGGTRWKKTLESTQDAIEGYATDLLKIYAERELRGGISYPEDSSEMNAFEQEFPFEETQDQLEAIRSIKKDMQSKEPMDRLVCGDVGYGKTEVAMRAAFKAACDGKKQVAILVPTTVLALQHYETFSDRMANFSVKVACLSRFQTSKQIKESLKEIENGDVNIVIGTHRLVSKDVKFKDLGLIVIDEEQRFGVKAKEHLKKIKSGVDCITLSATPIPRTLYLSLTGARDLSLINSPPQDRIPLKTIVTESKDEIIRTAILRELSRGGQVFFIHNRVETIEKISAKIRTLLPHARILIAHGQMSSHDLDRVFHAFKSGQADVLVATTIVENGIDIPNANTILVDRADHFGLADLYQLRGRVGRWNRLAYAFLLVPKIDRLPLISKQRLAAISEASGYGGGIKIAMRDLEIRGAGNILGVSQSGHVASIGFQLYCKLLKRTIQVLQGKAKATFFETKLELPFDARLPVDYVNDVSLRMDIYQRLGEAMTTEDIDLILAELIDRFGPAPTPVRWLHCFARIRIKASEHQIHCIRMKKLSLEIERKLGRKSAIKKCLIGKVDSPADLEREVIRAIETPTDSK